MPRASRRRDRSLSLHWVDALRYLRSSSVGSGVNTAKRVRETSTHDVIKHILIVLLSFQSPSIPAQTPYTRLLVHRHPIHRRCFVHLLGLVQRIDRNALRFHPRFTKPHPLRTPAPRLQRLHCRAELHCFQRPRPRPPHAPTSSGVR